MLIYGIASLFAEASDLICVGLQVESTTNHSSGLSNLPSRNQPRTTDAEYSLLLSRIIISVRGAEQGRRRKFVTMQLAVTFD